MPPESTLFTTIRNWFEVIYFGAGILLPIIALFALRQVQLAKEQLKATREIAKTSAKRESYRAAIEQCETLSKTVVPLDFEINKFIEENKITFFNKIEMKVEETGFKFNLSNIDTSELEKLSQIEQQFSDLVNSLEVFAIYFLAGIAYEEIGFHSQGKYFVDKAEMVSKLLTVCKSGHDECKHIWPLYKKWNDKITHQRLIIEKNKIDAQLKATVIQPTIKNIGV